MSYKDVFIRNTGFCACERPIDKEGFVKPAGTTVDIVGNVVLPMTIVVKPIEAQNKSYLPIVVDSCRTAVKI